MSAAVAALKEGYPEVEYAARMYWSSDHLFTYGDKNLKSQGNEVDADFLRIFDFPAVHGSVGNMLSEPNAIVLTESLAKRLFGDENPVGKTVTLDNAEPYQVTGVLKDLPSYTDFDFSYLTSLASDETTYGNNWNTNTYYTFVTLQHGTDAVAFNKKIAELVRTNAPDQKWTSLFLYPISDIHLYSRFENGVPAGGKIEEVRLVVIIGLLILCIASINFVNLSTARSQKRAKEVGVR